MKNKIFTVIGAITLICFSFYYTDSAVSIIKKNDPIMKEIISVSKDYDVYPQSAILIDNNIIPGVTGSRVDVDKSYSNMKRLGYYDKSLLVFEEVIPSITTIDNYDNYIVSGNQSKKEVSLIFTIFNTSYIEEILTLLSNKNIKVSFFLDDNVFLNSEDIIKLILLYGHRVESLGKDRSYDEDTLIQHSNRLSGISKNILTYCYLEKEDNSVLSTCKERKLHTIIPNIITGDFPYHDVKSKINNGSIIKLNNSKEVLRELPSIINYILQKGYKVVLLDNLLME